MISSQELSETLRAPVPGVPSAEQPRPVRLLHLEDNPADAQLIQLEIASADPPLAASLHVVATGKAFEAALNDCPADLILCDYRLPEYDGETALKTAQARLPDVPVIVVTGELGEERAIETLKAGATDYVLKDNLRRLVPSIRRALREGELLHRRRRDEEALRRSEEFFRMLFRSMMEAFCVGEVILDDGMHPVDFRFLETNDAFERQTELHEAKGRLMSTLAPDRAQHWSEILGAIGLTGAPARFEHEDRTLGRWYDVSAFKVGGPEEHQVAILINDITEHKRAMEAMRESSEAATRLAENLRLMVEVATKPRMLVNTEGLIETINSAGAKLLGYEAESIEGRSVMEFLVPPVSLELRMQLEDLRKRAPQPGAAVLRVMPRGGATELMTIEASLMTLAPSREKYLVRFEKLELAP